MRVLFVCDGNICRSPFAAEYLRDRAARFGPSKLVVDSVGLLGINGSQAAPFSIQVAAELGLDLSRHRSRGVAPSDIRIADMVIVMTSLQREALTRRFPSGCTKRWLVRAFEQGPSPRNGAPGLEDPVQGPIEGYREAFAIMRVCLDHLAAHLSDPA